MPIVLKKGDVKEVFLPGLPICSLFGPVEYKECKINLDRGDRVLFYTDGIAEARDINKEVYADRILELCKDNILVKSDKLIVNIIDDVMKFSNNKIDDDIAIMMMKVL